MIIACAGVDVADDGGVTKKAKDIVEAAKADPEKFGKLQADIDRTGHVDRRRMPGGRAIMKPSAGLAGGVEPKDDAFLLRRRIAGRIQPAIHGKYKPARIASAHAVGIFGILIKSFADRAK